MKNNIHYDVIIVGAGPAGLACAIRLGQLNAQRSRQAVLKIALIEKGASAGAHILSGAILNPTALNKLLPNWKTLNPPPYTPVNQEALLGLTRRSSLKLPISQSLTNKGCLIISLSQWCHWLAKQAEALGVDLYLKTAATHLLYNAKQAVEGIQTHEMGVDKHGCHTPLYQAGTQLFAKQTLLAEGSYGFLSQAAIQAFSLRSPNSPQTYSLGVKELWQIKPEQHKAGQVIHTLGWPFDRHTYGGGFIYHLHDNKVAIGVAAGLDSPNPYLDPHAELQRFKTHPQIQALFEGGRCLAYGARVINTGGWQALPTLSFPGGLLIGCAAGFFDTASLKGIHLAMHSGLLAADSIIETANRENLAHHTLHNYPDKVRSAGIIQALYRSRNIRPGFRKGLIIGLINAGLETWLLKGRAPWTLRHYPDYCQLDSARAYRPSPLTTDGKLTFDKLYSVFLSNTHHEENQPCHLIVKNKTALLQANQDYAFPETRYCPAHVYEIIEQDGKKQLQINPTNCLHCKACEIRDPKQLITWKPPLGGDGPNYNEL